VATNRAPALEHRLGAGGEAGGQILGHDWSSTPIGPVDRWPVALSTLVEVILGSNRPMFVVWGPERTLIYNAPYAEVLANKHPALGRDFLAVWHEIRADLQPLVARAYAGEATSMDDIPLTMERKGYREETYWHYAYIPIRAEDGTVGGFLCSCHEVTDQVRSLRNRAFRLALEDRLRSIEAPDEMIGAAVEMLRGHLGASRVAYAEDAGDEAHVMVTMDANDHVPSIKGTYRLTDFGRGLLSEMRAGRTIIHADVRTDPDLSDLEKAAHGGLDIVATANVPLVRAGRLVALIAVHYAAPHEYTPAETELAREVASRTFAAVERTRAEARLRDLNETLERRVAEAVAERQVFADVIEHSSAATMALDAQLDILAINAANIDTFERTYGKRPKAGDNLLGLLDDLPAHRAQLEPIFRRAVGGEEFVLTEVFGSEANTRAVFELRFSPLRDREGRQIGVVQTAQDVTDRVRAETELRAAQEALRQSQKMEAMGQLTGGVAHDFNNLLTPIVGALDLLKRKGVGGEREQRLIDGAAQSAERAKTLVQRLLAFARRQPLQPAPVDVARLVTGMGELVSSTTGPQIRVVVDAQTPLPAALADPNQLEMAILNLCVNARDAMPEGGTMRLSATAETLEPGHRSGLRPGRYVRISVSDTGLGMDEQTIARAVEPFFSTKGVGRGTGLGLSMVHGLALQSGGALTLQSRPGLGANVELWLPESEAAPDEVAREAPAASSGSHGTVLLVDDEPLVRMVAADILEDLGWAVLEAASAEDAMKITAGGAAFDLLMTDHLMPGMNGTELARRVKTQRPGVGVLLVSGYAEHEGVASDLPRLTKPFGRDELALILASLGTPNQG
jgi:signal transduction histidine kinase/CheY-like chemotaxis protein